MTTSRRQILQTGALGWVALHTGQPAHAAAAAANDFAYGAPWFPMGTHIYREPHLPMPELLADLPILKRLGFSMIKIQESWAFDERTEGHVDTSNIEQLVAAARTEGLRVFFGITMEHAPAWLWRKHPDAAMVFEDGLVNVDPTAYVVPADGKPGPCWHHSGARQAATRFLTTLVKRMSKFDNIAVWNLWQEVGFYSWSSRTGHGKLCYCKNSIAAFQRWLRERYVTIGKLNDVWRTPYASFGDVQPPRVFHMVPATIDWREFMDAQYFAHALAFKAAVFKRGDRLQRPVMSHVSGPTVGSTTEFSYAQQVDVFGTSVYPDWASGEWESPLMALEQTRSAAAGKPFWAAELQGGPIGEGLAIRRTPTARDVRRWVLMSVAMGAKGVCFWNHRPEPLWNEAHGFGLFNISNPPGPRAQVAGDLGRELGHHAEFLLNASPAPAQLGLVLSQDMHHIAEATGGELQRAWKAALRGSYRMCWDAAVPVTFVDINDTATRANNSPLPRILWFPMALAMSDATVMAIKQHVESGGHVILEAGAGHLDRYGVAHAELMSPDLLSWLGIQVGALVPVAAPDGGPALGTSADRTGFRVLKGVGIGKGHEVPTGSVLQSITLGSNAIDAVVLQDAEAAYGVLVNKGTRGGQVAVLGTHPGVARQLFNDTRASGFFVDLLAAMGTTPDKLEGLPRRRFVAGNREAWFLFNPEPKPKSVSLSKALAGRRATLVGSAFKAGETIEVDDIVCVLVEASP